MRAQRTRLLCNLVVHVTLVTLSFSLILLLSLSLAVR